MFSLMACSKEMLRGNHFDFAGLDVGFGDDALDAAPVVNVAVSVNDGHNRFLADMVVNQLHAGPGGFGGNERVNDNVTVVGFDDAHHR